jgi:hypothetical protein
MSVVHVLSTNTPYAQIRCRSTCKSYKLDRSPVMRVKTRSVARGMQAVGDSVQQPEPEGQPQPEQSESLVYLHFTLLGEFRPKVCSVNAGRRIASLGACRPKACDALLGECRPKTPKTSNLFALQRLYRTVATCFSLFSGTG